jgi:hypothetical protein
MVQMICKFDSICEKYENLKIQNENENELKIKFLFGFKGQIVRCMLIGGLSAN